jgi:hypothetical protein
LPESKTLAVGDKVRYKLDGRTWSMRGLEGTITELYNSTCTVGITKTNGSINWPVGDEFFPDLLNLELLWVPEATPIVETSDGEAVVHPAHYGGDTTYEAIKVIEAWGLGFHLGNTVKYISRAGKKDKRKLLEDLKKALWYLQRKITKLEEELSTTK